MHVKLSLDEETFQRLVQEAQRERRPTAWHAEVLLRRALGLPFPHSLSEPAKPAPPAKPSVPSASGGAAS